MDILSCVSLEIFGWCISVVHFLLDFWLVCFFGIQHVSHISIVINGDVPVHNNTSRNKVFPLTYTIYLSDFFPDISKETLVLLNVYFIG